ncbi:glycosyl transferase family 1 [Altererythrobacter sp. B11]|uniref:glycosyltransferase family 4 protein n=1 Tax=Altererythrobacter sp. B11 TaxID=2060312 RepID=UPI000DC70BD7|nr:glycosyltransferase family 4 protein [Altererythrobacter sp. B11]BBC72985.1 glycosyl transferase family 1 [Altererythrobacter sp. B11]
MDTGNLAGRRLWVMAKGYTPDEGGMQTYARGVAHAYAQAGAEVTVFTQTSAGPRRERVGPVLVVDIGAGKGVSVPLRFRTAMRQELRRAGPPLLVHGTTWRTSVMPLLLGLPYFTTFHGREFMYAGGISLRLMRHVARRARRIVAVSHHSAGRLAARLGPGMPEPIVAWNGTSGTSSPASPHPAGTEPFLLSLCRLEPRKNIAACLRACAAMRREGRRFRYAIAGRGPELAALRALAAELELGEQVEILGFVTEEHAAQLYARADIFLHPQVEADGGRDFEGFGIAIADAMLAGAVPVVGREGGAIELIEEGISGHAVDGHDPDALAEVLRGLLDEPARRHRMAEAATARAADLFTWDRHIATILRALEAPQAAPAQPS